MLRYLLLVLATQIPVRGDISSLADYGPHTGSAFSNLGAVGDGTPLPTMAEAVVTIRLIPGEGDDLIAECSATFSMDAGPKQLQPIAVAFPATGQSGNSVSITSFKVMINGVEVKQLRRGPIRFRRTEGKDTAGNDEQPTVAQLMRGPWLPSQGYNVEGFTYPDAYYWSQVFPANARTSIEVRYRLTLRPQPLRYEKKMAHGGNIDVVPFDLMWAGASNEQAYFFDYILRSGATWAGPIGHETVTLTADPATQLDLTAEEVVIVGRSVARYWYDDTRDSRAMRRAGILPKKIRRTGNQIVWEIDHEKPTQDILVEIPLSLRKHPNEK